MNINILVYLFIFFLAELDEKTEKSHIRNIDQKNR